MLAVAGSLLLPLACSAQETGPSASSDSAAGAAGEIAGQGGTTDAERNTAGSAQGGAGAGGERETPTASGAGGSEGGEAGAAVVPTNAGGEAGSGLIANEAGQSGERGANAGADASGAGAAGEAGAAGSAGAPPSKVTAEQRALCESICAKEPLTNGFAGAPSAPCPDTENCADLLCGYTDVFWMPNETCMHAFTDYLTCLDSQPAEAYECASYGPILSVGCENEDATMWAVCG